MYNNHRNNFQCCLVAKLKFRGKYFNYTILLVTVACEQQHTIINIQKYLLIASDLYKNLAFHKKKIRYG